MKEPGAFARSVYGRLRRVPAGRVTTYSELARAIGRPRAARSVGGALNRNPFAPVVPCHRVVRADGSLGGFARGARAKARLLAAEGIRIKGGRIADFNKIFYRFSRRPKSASRVRKNRDNSSTWRAG